jgi:hypothetical protein
MGKKINFALFALTLSILFLPFTSAASFSFENSRYQVTQAIEAVLGFLSPLFENIIGDYSTSEFFFHKILLLILLVIICKYVLEKTPLGENKKVSFLISAIISILSIRFINENDLFEAIFIQYGALGIAISTILPMVIFFYFVHNTKVGTYGRKMFWTLYVIIMGAIWLIKSSQIPEVANWIYALSMIAAVIFILFDRSIHSYFGLSEFKAFQKQSNKKRILEVKEEMDKLEDHFHKRRISWYDYIAEKKRLEALIKEYSKE